MAHDVLVEEANEAINEVFRDTSVCKKQVMESLQELSDNIQAMLNCLNVQVFSRVRGNSTRSCKEINSDNLRHSEALTYALIRMAVHEASRDYACSICGDTIDMGTSYVKHVFLEDGKFKVWRQHDRTGCCAINDNEAYYL